MFCSGPPGSRENLSRAAWVGGEVYAFDEMLGHMAHLGDFAPRFHAIPRAWLASPPVSKIGKWSPRNILFATSSESNNLLRMANWIRRNGSRGPRTLRAGLLKSRAKWVRFRRFWILAVFSLVLRAFGRSMPLSTWALGRLMPTSPTYLSLQFRVLFGLGGWMLTSFPRRPFFWEIDIYQHGSSAPW